MKKLAAVLGAVILAGSAQATYIFSALDVAVTENFDTYNGTAAPANWTLTSNNRNGANATPAAFQGNVMANNTSGGWRSYRVSTLTGGSLGFLGNGNYGGGNGNGTVNNNDLNFATMIADFKNETGTLITELSISYAGEQWQDQASRPSYIFFSYSTDGSAWTDVSSLQFNAIATGGTFFQNGDSASWRNVLSANVTGLSIANNNTVQLRWSYNGAGGSGSRQGLAIDDLSVTAVPEPASIALMVLAGAAVVAYRRSRKPRGE
jgi:hypothetical protein